MLVQRCDITIPGSSNKFKDACTDSTHIYTITDEDKFRSYTLSGNNDVTSTLSSTAEGIVLGTSATACVCYATTNFSFINVTTGQVTTITTNAGAANTNNSSQQLAAQPSVAKVLQTTQTNGQVKLINVTSQSISNISPSPLSGAQPTCVLAHSASATFFVGTNNGKVFELDSSGNTTGVTITVPTTPNRNSTPTIKITGLTHWNNTLGVVTDRGAMYFYTWPDKTFIKAFMTTEDQGSSSFTGLCYSASGYSLIARKGTLTNAAAPVQSIVIGNGPSANITTNDLFFNEINQSVESVGIEPSQNLAWALFNTATGLQGRLYTITPTLTFSSETTRSQNPTNVDVAARVIRIRDDGIGRSFIEVDQNVASGSVSLPCTSGHNYIELSIISGSKGDVREFTG